MLDPNRPMVPLFFSEIEGKAEAASSCLAIDGSRLRIKATFSSTMRENRSSKANALSFFDMMEIFGGATILAIHLQSLLNRFAKS
jgi:hypothetical protein